MDGASYLRHNSFHGVVTKSASYYPTEPVGARNKNQQRYNSDPTLLDDKEVVNLEREGRRSALDNYSSYQEGSKEARKAKKKKLKKLKSFMHVFLGGLRRHQSIHGSQQQENDSEIIPVHYQQKKEVSIRLGSDPTHSRNSGAGPLKGHFSSTHTSPTRVDIPGLCGLHNHGNTCFMNAILQCLSNTDQLAEYFVTDQYKNDLNRQKLSARTFGGHGDVTEQFAMLLKCLWNGRYDPVVTGRFKEMIGRHASQYQGSSQHDAQEFFLWLLDNIHEDLNQAGKKKYRPIKDSTGRPDEEVAAETLQSHKKRNNSFIQNLFQGQFRSAVTCPSCGSRSSTFDPYVCVSLPLPQRDRRPIYVTVVYRSSSRSHRVYGVNVPIDASIRDMRNSLAQLCGVNRYHLVLTDLQPSGFNRTFYDDQHLSVINSGDLVFGFECPPYRGDNPEAITQSNPSGSKELMLVLVINKLGETQFGKRFGRPLILRVWRDLTHSQFQSVVLKAMVGYLREGIRLADVCRSGVLFNCRVVDGLPDRSVLPADADHPFYSPSVDKALHVSMLYGGPAHIKLVAEWEPDVKARIFGVVADEVPEPHQSVLELRQLYQQPLNATLDDCLKIYTKEETLNREDSWLCPHCKHQQQDATKKITLWTLPDVLVIHLKRFRHIGYCRTKLNTLVSFPIRGLDMTPFLAPRSSHRPASATLQRRAQVNTTRTKTFPSQSKSVRFEEVSPSSKNVGRSVTKESKFHFPWKKKKNEGELSPKRSEGNFTPGVCDSPSSVRSAPSAVGNSLFPGQRVHSPAHSVDGSDMRSRSPGSLEPASTDNVYDLYAVCNHLGTMTRGHYTAFCRNPADGHWYMFDDNHVQPLSEEQLGTAGAYLLFYVRQSLLNQLPPLSSTSSSSSSSGSSSHWAMHIPRFQLDVTGSLGSSEGTYSPNHNGGNYEAKSSRPRLGSTHSAVSAPPIPTKTGGISPQSPSESDVFVQHGRCASDNHSGVSLPPSSQPLLSSTPLHHHQLSPTRIASYHHHHPPLKHTFSSPGNHQLGTSGGRQASLRLGRPRQLSCDGTIQQPGDQYLRRGTSFHGSQYHQVYQRGLTDSGRVIDLPPHPAYPSSGQGLAVPSRSIPNMTADFSVNNHSYPLPSRSIPDISVHTSPPLSAKEILPLDNASHFMTPQPRRTRTLSMGQSSRKSANESCV